MLNMVKTKINSIGKIQLIFLKLEICPWEVNSFTKSLIIRFYQIKSYNQAFGERVYLLRTNLKF